MIESPEGHGWWPVALAETIAPGSSAGTRLSGRELVVWRDAAGQPHVWEDRCPHRGMRLSFGFVRGSLIACLYHGWQFGPDGRCSHIPAHPDLRVPATIRATIYPAAEHLGIIWVHDGPGHAAGPPGVAAAIVPVRSLALRAPADKATSALLTAPSPFGPAEIRRDGPLVVLQSGPRAVIAAVQSRTEAASVVHLVLSGPLDDRAAAQARVSAWSEALRRAIEAPA